LSRITAKDNKLSAGGVNSARSLQLLGRAQESRNKEPPQGHRFKGGFSLRLMGKKSPKPI